MIQSRNGMKDPMALVILIQRTGFGLAGSVSQARLRSQAVTFIESQEEGPVDRPLRVGVEDAAARPRG
jgi:hypothetical protein